MQAHRGRSQGATTSDSAIFARIFSRGIAMGRSGVTGMACLPSLIGDNLDLPRYSLIAHWFQRLHFAEPVTSISFLYLFSF